MTLNLNTSVANYLQHFQSLIDMLVHYNMNIVEDNAFLKKAGTFLEEEDPDKSESNYIDLKTKFNLKKILASRNCSIAVSFLKRTYTCRY